jgi:hypothetical protein
MDIVSPPVPTREYIASPVNLQAPKSERESD